MKTQTVTDERCERCLRLFLSSGITTVGAERLCVATCASGAPTVRRGARRATIAPDARGGRTATQKRPAPVRGASKRPDAQNDDSEARCERCMALFSIESMTHYETEHLCTTCLTKAKTKWYAVSVRVSDAKAAKAIKQSFQRDQVRHMLKDVLIPKVRKVKRTKPRWDVLDHYDKVVGQVTAEDHAEALHAAMTQFARNRKKTVYKPDLEAQAELMTRVEKTKEGRRVYYQAFSESGRMMGRVTGYKNLKQATEALTRLYGPKDKPTNPRESVAQCDVKDVRLAKEGGRVMIQNERAMKGYLLVQCLEDELAFDAIKSAKGVNTILPYTEKMSYEKWEKAADFGDLSNPHTASDEEVEKIKTPQEPPTLSFVVGDQIRLSSADKTYAGLWGRVLKIGGSIYSPDVTVEVTLWGRPVKMTVPHTSVEKA